MFTILLAGMLLVELYGQNIDCNLPVGTNTSSLGLFPETYGALARDGFPYPYGAFISIYANGTFEFTHQTMPNGSNVLLGTAVYNISRADANVDLDCYLKLTWQTGNWVGQSGCMGYTVITEPSSIFGCYYLNSTECPTSCTPQYVSQLNHAWFANLIFDNLTPAKSIHKGTDKRLITHSKSAAPDCSAIVGYNTSVILYNTYYPAFQYISIYRNGSYIAHQYNGSYLDSSIYNVSVSKSPSVDCNMYLISDQSGTVCVSYSITMNGTGAIGCIFSNSTCPSSCLSMNFINNENVWWAGFRMNPL